MPILAPGREPLRAGLRIFNMMRTHRSILTAWTVGWTTAWTAGMVAACALSGCTYERRIGYKPFFTGLAGAQISTPASADVSRPRTSAVTLTEPRVTNADGSITLVNATGRHLMANIMYCLDEDDAALFVEQVLSQRAIDDAYAHSREPKEIFEILKERRGDVLELFMRMPLGEHSPMVIMKPLGPNAFEIALTKDAARGLHWSSLTMVLENGGWRLVWFGK